MGYQVTFVPTEDKMKEYKPWNDDKPRESMVENYKFELISYCMKTTDPVYQVIKNIKFHLNIIASMVESDEKQNAYFRWKNDENHELWYCGWEFSQDARFNKEDTIETTVESLFIQANLVPTPDYFENSENFFHKYNEVKEQIDEFIELMQELAIHNIINDMDSFKKKYDEEEE